MNLWLTFKMIFNLITYNYEIGKVGGFPQEELSGERTPGVNCYWDKQACTSTNDSMDILVARTNLGPAASLICVASRWDHIKRK